MEASNRHFSLTAAKAPERSRQWNEIIEKLKSATVPLVRRQIAKAAFENKLPQVFEDTVQWDILGVCVEAEYSDVQSPGFYASQAYWYINGHFPCGWRGPFPEGQIILY